MIMLSAAFGAVAGLLGALASASVPHLPTGPAIVVIVSVIVGLSLLFAPRRGIIAGARLRSQQRWRFAQEALAVHLLQHEGGPNEANESTSAHMGAHMRWDPAFAGQVMQRAAVNGLVMRDNGSLRLTDAGRETARRAMTR
jgi:manganese/zinc/iron transport system permease protein